MAKAGPSAAEKRNQRNLEQETRSAESYALVLKTLQWSIKHRILVCKMFLEPELYPEFDEKIIVDYIRSSACMYYRPSDARNAPSSEWEQLAEEFFNARSEVEEEPIKVKLKANRNALVSEVVNMMELTLLNVRADYSEKYDDALREASEKSYVQRDHTGDSQELIGKLVEDIYGAVESGKVEDFKRLMGLIPVEHWAFERMAYWKATPLHWAALHGQDEMVCFIQDELESVDDDTKLAIVNATDDHGFTPLHMAVLYARPERIELPREVLSAEDEHQEYFKMWKSSQVICRLHEMGANSSAHQCAPWMCIWTYRGRLSCVLVRDDFLFFSKIHPIHLALWLGREEVVEILIEKFLTTASKETQGGDSILHLAAWHVYGISSEIMDVLFKHFNRQSPDTTVNSMNCDKQTPLHIAAFTGNYDAVRTLLRLPYTKLNERNFKGYTPQKIAISILRGKIEGEHIELTDEHFQAFGISHPFGAINKLKLDVSSMKHICAMFDDLNPDDLQKERQVYVDAANAVLVGAALIVSASFGAWLAPPLGYMPYYSPEFLVTNGGAAPGTYESFVGIEQHPIIQLFWIFNSLSFFFSLATVIAGADAAIPEEDSENLREALNSVRKGVKWALFLLSMAILCVIGTFITIGFAILPPMEKYRINMYCTLSIGLLVCGFVLLRLLRKLKIDIRGWINEVTNQTRKKLLGIYHKLSKGWQRFWVQYTCCTKAPIEGPVPPIVRQVSTKAPIEGPVPPIVKQFHV